MKLSSFTTIIVFLILVLVGVALVHLLPFKLKPSDTIPSVTVNYSWQGAEAKVIDQEVTSVLEGLFSRVRGVKKISSTSSIGRGSVSIDFDKTVNSDAIRFEIATLIRQVYPTLPDQVNFRQISIQSSDLESSKLLFVYTLNANTAPYLIQKYAESKILPILSQIRGVEGIDVYGASPMEWVMEYNVDFFKELQITTNDIQNALKQYLISDPVGLGYEILPGSDTTVINLVLRNYQAKNVDLLNIPVKCVGKRIVRLKDILTLRHLEQNSTTYYRINGSNTIAIPIYVGSFENQLQLSRKIKEKIKEIENNLPKNYFLFKYYDTSEFIRLELMKNIWRALLTITVLLLFVLIVTRNWRYLMLIILSLIANLAIAAIFYYLLKIEMHIYSLAGITVSLSLIKNNSIVMIDHLQHHKNLKVFMAILAATLAAIAALMMTFLLDEYLRLFLFDFSVIVIINLAVSLFIALFLIPALMEKFPQLNHEKWEMGHSLFLKRKLRQKLIFTVRLTRLYGRLITFVCKFRWAFIILAILGFGLPVHMLPDRIDKDNLYARTYNHTLGSDWYRQNIKPITNKVLGGALQLFNLNTYKNSYYGDLEKTTLYVDAKMPFGSTLNQMNELVTSVENYLKQFTEIEQFQTIVSAGEASITIYFKKNFDNNEFPFQLQNMVTQKANDLGGADWVVQGVGEGFHNAARETPGQYRVTMYGYNYDELFALAEKVRTKLMENARIKDITIMSRNSTFIEESIAYVMDFDQQRLITQDVSPSSLYSSLMDFNKIEKVIGNTIVGGESERLRLVSKQSKEMDLWQIQHTPGKFGNAMIKMNNISNIKKEALRQDIVRENHQYSLILAYDYIGLDQLATQNQKQIISEVKSILPLGYTIEGSGNPALLVNEDTQQYWWLIIIIIAIIYFICSSLFESLLLPLAVILMIPLSYIGVFLTFPLFNINFDQGGFASFILLSGITVNSALYIINDFNNLKRKKTVQKISTLRLYLKAYNQKIFPILLTILSTILGLVPFLLGGKQEAFWPALAAGTIGGLIFSLIALWIYLPMILINKRTS